MYRWRSRYALVAVASGTLWWGCGAFGDPPRGDLGTTTVVPPDNSTVPTTAAVTDPGPTVTSPGGSPPGDGPASAATLLRADLSGRAAPGGGDPDGSGRAIITSDEHGDEVCFSLTVAGVGAVSGFHVHEGGAGADGAVLVDMTKPDTASERGCLTVGAGVLARIAAAPAGFYVDVHTVDHPGGALRGQLS